MFTSAARVRDAFVANQFLSERKNSAEGLKKNKGESFFNYEHKKHEYNLCPRLR